MDGNHLTSALLTLAHPSPVFIMAAASTALPAANVTALLMPEDLHGWKLTVPPQSTKAFLHL